MGESLGKVLLTVSPTRPSFSPPARVFSQPPLALQPDFYASGASSFLSMICRLLILGSLFCPRFLCFHQLADSFCKMPGVGYPDPVFGPSEGADEDPRCGRRTYGAPEVGHTQNAGLASVTTFRINTCKSVSKQMTLTTFRINTYEKRGGGGTDGEGYRPGTSLTEQTGSIPNTVRIRTYRNTGAGGAGAMIAPVAVLRPRRCDGRPPRPKPWDSLPSRWVIRSRPSRSDCGPPKSGPRDLSRKSGASRPCAHCP